MPKNEELTAVFQAEAYVFGADADRTIIGKCDGGNTIKGRAAEGELERGITYRFLGHWRVHPKYGKQFWFNSFCISEPATKRGIVSYLKKAPNFGVAHATKAFALWGSEAVKIVRERPDRAATMIKGLSLNGACEAAAWLEQHKRVERVTIDLVDLLDGRGFPRTLVQRCIGRWGEGAAATIRDNPYKLLVFHGVGFLGADKLWLELGHPPDAIERQAMAAWHELASDMNGNTWLPRQQCESSISHRVSGSNVDAEAAVAHGLENDLFRQFDNGRSFLADSGRADSEAALAGWLRDAMQESEDEFGFPCFDKLQWPKV